jgi:hypothetical protein
LSDPENAGKNMKPSDGQVGPFAETVVQLQTSLI